MTTTLLIIAYVLSLPVTLWLAVPRYRGWTALWALLAFSAGPAAVVALIVADWFHMSQPATASQRA